MSRSDRYAEQRRSRTFLLGEGDQQVAEYVESLQKAKLDIWTCTKEIIYRQTSTGPEWHYVLHMLDAATLDLVVANALYQKDLEDREVLHILAMALINEIPVYPDTASDEPGLAAWHERLQKEGFRTDDTDGKELHFLLGPNLTRKLGGDPLESLTTTRMLSPAEIALAKADLSKRLAELSAAQSMLDRLDAAIASLETVLASTRRNEHALQDCITKHPVLFGPEYRRVIPKHRLGNDYEMDYALERLAGFVDLVELESSTLDLYNQAGDPRSELVHAEQQVMDWIEWMQAQGSYARDKLAGIHRPRGFVVIGRRSSLDGLLSKKLEQRNRFLSDVLEILTYDDLLDRAKHLRALFIGPTSPVLATSGDAA